MWSWCVCNVHNIEFVWIGTTYGHMHLNCVPWTIRLVFSTQIQNNGCITIFRLDTQKCVFLTNFSLIYSLESTIFMWSWFIRTMIYKIVVSINGINCNEIEIATNQFWILSMRTILPMSFSQRTLWWFTEN